MSDEHMTKQTKVRLPTNEDNLLEELKSIMNKDLKRKIIIGVK